MGKHKGFTIVELMVVIVVIAILARVVFVAFNNVQARSRDTIRKNDVSSLAKQIQIYAQQRQSWSGIACGDTTNTMSGYTNVTYAPNSTITDCLKTFYDTNKQLNDPSGCVSMTDTAAACKQNIRSAYKAVSTGAHYFIVTKLETETGQLSGYTDADASGIKAGLITEGFNYILKVR